jgi:hypothetical protein
VAVVGEPALAFYLHLSGRPALPPVENPEQLNNLREPVYLVTGAYASRAPATREALKDLGPRLTPLARYPLSPNDVRLLDDFHPPQARLFRASPDDSYEVTLSRLSPGP